MQGETGYFTCDINVIIGVTGRQCLKSANSRRFRRTLCALPVTSVATGGLDALPHNGAVITLLSICKLTHRQSYLDIFMVAVAGPIVALVALITLGTLVGSF